MPAGIVLLAAVASAAVAGMILPEGAARAYVYGRAWFHVLLGLFGVSLAGCMLRRILSRSMTTWSLLAHGGIVLILVGAAVTLISAERGALVICEGETVDSFAPEDRSLEDRVPLGFAVRLLDFRIERYPPVDYLVVIRRDRRTLRIKLDRGGQVGISETDVLLRDVRFLPGPGDGVVEVLLPDGTKASVPAKVGTAPELETGTSIKILRYEPSFKIDVETKEVTSDADQPTNPALQVQLIADGGPQPPRWLFARLPGFRHDRREDEAEPSAAEMSFLHPARPVVEAEAVTPSGPKRFRIAEGSFVRSPSDPTSLLGYERNAGRPKEYESEVELVEEGRAVKRHVIRVNDPLKHRGTALHQLDYDHEGLRWSVLGVSRDRGVWFVFAGFIAASAGLAGKFYLRPLLKRAGRPRDEEGGAGGTA